MSSVPLANIAARIDQLLRTRETPDYPSALNGVQVDHVGPVVKVAAAVDVSTRTIRAAVEAGANLLIVHHGLFWGGLQPLTGALYARVRLLLDSDVALYSAHLPLDVHPAMGNSVLLAAELGLETGASFARYQTVYCGVRGECMLSTVALLDRVRAFSLSHGGHAFSSPIAAGRRTTRWAICSGAGADANTIREAIELGVDTLITGEGSHWTSVDAEDKALVIIYAGHYASETLGVRALATRLGTEFGLPSTFVAAPTGL